MLKDEILQRLQADKPALDRFGVKSIALFGSFARGEARADSDLDIPSTIERTQDPTSSISSS